MAIVEDPSTPAVVTATTTTTSVTTASFSPPANSLILVIVSTFDASVTDTGTVSWTGTGTFNLAVRENTASTFHDVGIWWFQVGNADLAPVTVTFTPNNSGRNNCQNLAVRVLLGAKNGAAAIGATVTSTTVLNAPITQSAKDGGSYIAAASACFNASDGTTAVANTTTLAHAFHSSAGVTATGKLTNLTSALPSGALTMGWSNTGTADNGFVAAEILPAPTMQLNSYQQLKVHDGMSTTEKIR